ncbi:MAG: hypothetical protein NT067_01635 [Candidatus Diapherotrites archaeon]|nr:hypothetical protein [Candidatus Diapherotrites archaeon]
MKKILLASVLAIAILAIMANASAYDVKMIGPGDVAKFAIPKGYAVDATALENEINHDLEFYREHPDNTPGIKNFGHFVIYAEEIYTGPYPVFMVPVPIGAVEVWETVFKVEVRVEGNWLMVNADLNAKRLATTSSVSGSTSKKTVAKASGAKMQTTTVKISNYRKAAATAKTTVSGARAATVKSASSSKRYRK